MITLSFGENNLRSPTVLCLGAHSDDIEIGCGGTLLQFKQTYSDLKIYWVVFCAAGMRGREAAKAADLFTVGCQKAIVLKEFRDGFLPYLGAEVKDIFEELKGQVSPDLIFTHWRGDAHQDHRLISELTWNTFRKHFILEYEIPKYDGDLGRPNIFMPLEKPLQEQKVTHLFEAFASQQTKPWFDRNTFLGLMRLRGMESNSPSGYAEAFYARKMILNV
jgi:LmbE family N-acetylglucosaminyl deacetylase